jgi:hypothetical protein
MWSFSNHTVPKIFLILLFFNHMITPLDSTRLLYSSNHGLKFPFTAHSYIYVWLPNSPIKDNHPEDCNCSLC